MKFSRLIILVCTAHLSLNLMAQGLVFNDQSYKDVPKEEYRSEGSKNGETLLKDNLKIDLKPYCPSIKEQGKISSCVGWSVGYAALTIEKAIKNGWAGKQQIIDDHAYSAMFLFNQIKLGDCSFGAELNHAFKFLKENGNVHYKEFDVGYNCDSVPLKQLSLKAQLNKIQDFATLFHPNEKPETKVNRVKLALAHHKPVVVGMVVLENFLTLKSNDKIWYPNIGKTEVFGGHAMVVVGYDEGKKAFEVMNSWGSGWANQGYVWIKYDDFATYCKYAYQFMLNRDDLNYLEGTIQVLKPVIKTFDGERNDVLFSPLHFVYKNDRFKFQQQKMPLPITFQVVAEGLRKGSYLYAIGFDNEMRATVYWPRDENFNRQFIGEYESALISNNARIVIPGKYNVFNITNPGTEYLCLLATNGQIKNLPRRIEQIKTLKGDIFSRLQKAFNNKIVMSESLGYDKDAINIFAGVDPTEIIAVLLEFEVKK